MAFGIFAGGEPIDLPHPPIPLSIFLIVEKALCAGWQILLVQPREGFDLATATEDEITHELHEAVVNRVFDSGAVEGFTRDVFAPLVRAPKIRNYDYSSLDRMPDLFLQLVNRPTAVIKSQDGIFIECKPVDQSHPIITHYCNKGIMRFVKGEYAWAMSSAMMVAYAHENYRIMPLLGNALKDHASIVTTVSPHPCQFSRSGPLSETVYISEHQRKLHNEGDLKVDTIVLRHLWLTRQ